MKDFDTLLLRATELRNKTMHLMGTNEPTRAGGDCNLPRRGLLRDEGRARPFARFG